MRRGEFEDEAARVDLDKAVKADPQRASAHHNYSMALGRTGQLVAAIDEILRMDDPFVSNRRVTTAETVVGGVPLPAGEQVVLHWTAANRDPEAFEDADRFVIDRRKNRHAAFGLGIHRCLGSNLARMELQEIFRAVATHFHDLEMTAPPRRLRSTFINGVKEMRVRFRPGARIEA